MKHDRIYWEDVVRMTGVAGWPADPAETPGNGYKPPSLRRKWTMLSDYVVLNGGPAIRRAGYSHAGTRRPKGLGFGPALIGASLLGALIWSAIIAATWALMH